MASYVAPFESQDNQLQVDVFTIAEEPTEAERPKLLKVRVNGESEGPMISPSKMVKMQENGP